MRDLILAVENLVNDVRAGPLSTLQVKEGQVSWLQNTGIFDQVDPKLSQKVLDLAAAVTSEGNLEISRAIGCLVSMSVADGLGHNFEFLPVQDVSDTSTSYLVFPSNENKSEKDRGRLQRVLNRFRLKAGQWTDDTSMGLCLADSILIHGGYDGTKARIWFWNWWNNGLNNGFRYDSERCKVGEQHSLSVGLGGNISKSLENVGRLVRSGMAVPACFESISEDAGNGSLMRLGAIPIRYHFDLQMARDTARKSSLATHPGALAADACDFMTFLIVRAILRGPDEPAVARIWLDMMRDDYLKRIAGGEVQARPELVRLVQAAEADSSTERCWNWRDGSLQLRETIARRGTTYNGFPVSAGYFGSFCLDGLAMALHAVYTTDSLNAAIVKVVNMAGDSDTTGAICGQIAGAFYGINALNPAWVEDLNRWDRREIELRAIALYAEAQHHGSGSVSCIPGPAGACSKAPASQIAPWRSFGPGRLALQAAAWTAPVAAAAAVAWRWFRYLGMSLQQLAASGYATLARFFVPAARRDSGASSADESVDRMLQAAAAGDDIVFSATLNQLRQRWRWELADVLAVRDGGGCTAAHLAAGNGRLAVVERIVSVTADGGAAARPALCLVNSDQRSAVLLALANGHEAAAVALLRAGASADGTGPRRRNAVFLAAQRGLAGAMRALAEAHGAEAFRALACAADAGGYTALHAAALAGDADSCSLLLDAGVPAAAAARDGSNVLHAAARCAATPPADGPSREALFERLVTACGPEALAAADCFGASPVHAAAVAGNVALLRCLVGRMPRGQVAAGALRDDDGTHPTQARGPRHAPIRSPFASLSRPTQVGAGRWPSNRAACAPFLSCLGHARTSQWRHCPSHMAG